jgi:hypothetical protein
VQVFKDYLRESRGIKSHIQSTADLGVHIANLSPEKELFMQMLQTLRLADGVKFARYQPTEDEKEAALEKIIESVKSIEQLA